MISAVIYARTSPDCPLPAEDQIAGLKDIAANHGITVSRIFVDKPMLNGDLERNVAFRHVRIDVIPLSAASARPDLAWSGRRS
jgi:hypothetical protein